MSGFDLHISAGEGMCAYEIRDKTLMLRFSQTAMSVGFASFICDTLPCLCAESSIDRLTLDGTVPTNVNVGRLISNYVCYGFRVFMFDHDFECEYNGSIEENEALSNVALPVTKKAIIRLCFFREEENRVSDGFASFLCQTLPCLCAERNISNIKLDGTMPTNVNVSEMIVNCINHGFHSFMFENDFEYNFQDVDLIKVNDALSTVVLPFTVKWIKFVQMCPSYCTLRLLNILSRNEKALLSLQDKNLFDHLHHIWPFLDEVKATYGVSMTDYSAYLRLGEEWLGLLLDFVSRGFVYSFKMKLGFVLNKKGQFYLIDLLSSNETKRMGHVSLLNFHPETSGAIVTYLRSRNCPINEFVFSVDLEYGEENITIANMQILEEARKKPLKWLGLNCCDSVVNEINRLINDGNYEFMPSSLVSTEKDDENDIRFHEINEKLKPLCKLRAYEMLNLAYDVSGFGNGNVDVFNRIGSYLVGSPTIEILRSL